MEEEKQKEILEEKGEVQKKNKGIWVLVIILLLISGTLCFPYIKSLVVTDIRVKHSTGNILCLLDIANEKCNESNYNILDTGIKVKVYLNKVRYICNDTTEHDTFYFTNEELSSCDIDF